MTRIKTLSAANLKGETFTSDLAAVNIITGDNATGKTAYLAAIRLALLGFDPKLGKTPGGIFAACGCRGGGATSLIVRADLTDGTIIAKNWTMKKGKITYTGPDEQYIPPVMLDPTTFFGLTGPARLNYVLSQVDLGAIGLGWAPLQSKLESDLTAVVDSQNGKAAYIETVDTITKLENTRAADKGSIYDWLTATVEAITALKEKEARLADTHEQTLRGLTDNKAGDNDMSALQSVQPEINAARERHTAAVAAEATAAEQASAAATRLQEAKTLADQMVDESEIRTRISKGHEYIETQRKVAAPGEPPKAEAMETARPTDTNERTAWESANSDMYHQNNRLRLVNDGLTGIKAAIEAAKSKTTCPTCGQDISSKQQITITNLLCAQTAAEADVKIIIEAVSAASKAEQIASAGLIVASKAIKTWDDTAAGMTAQNEARRREWQHRQDEYNTAQQQINAATAKIQKLEASLTANAAAREAMAKLRVLARDSRIAGAARTVAGGAAAPIAEEIRQLEAKQRQFIARTQNERLANQSREQLATANARWAVFKAALKVVSEEKKRAAADAFGSLLKHTRRFTDGLLKAPLGYRDEEIGMMHDGNWISYKMFSGLEEVVSFAALGVALTQQHNGIRVVLMDEMGRASRRNKTLLTNRLRNLIGQGVIDQAFIVDVDAAGYPTGEDVKIIQVDDAGKLA